MRPFGQVQLRIKILFRYNIKKKIDRQLNESTVDNRCKDAAWRTRKSRVITVIYKSGDNSFREIMGAPWIAGLCPSRIIFEEQKKSSTISFIEDFFLPSVSRIIRHRFWQYYLPTARSTFIGIFIRARIDFFRQLNIYRGRCVSLIFYLSWKSNFKQTRNLAHRTHS